MASAPAPSASVPSARDHGEAVTSAETVSLHTDERALLREAALAITESVVADAVRLALNEDGRSLRALQDASGIDAAFLSRLANGKNCEVESLARLALALDKTLYISIE